MRRRCHQRPLWRQRHAWIAVGPNLRTAPALVAMKALAILAPPAPLPTPGASLAHYGCRQKVVCFQRPRRIPGVQAGTAPSHTQSLGILSPSQDLFETLWSNLIDEDIHTARFANKVKELERVERRALVPTAGIAENRRDRRRGVTVICERPLRSRRLRPRGWAPSDPS